MKLLTVLFSGEKNGTYTGNVRAERTHACAPLRFCYRKIRALLLCGFRAIAERAPEIVTVRRQHRSRTARGDRRVVRGISSEIS